MSTLIKGTVRALPMVALQAVDKTNFYYGNDQVALFRGTDKNYYGVHRSNPFTPLLVTGIKDPSISQSYNAVTDDLIALFDSLCVERCSIYKVVDNKLKFSRNVTFCMDHISWIIKSPGKYVIFTGSVDSPEVSGLEVSTKTKSVNPFSNGWPISHLAPRGAWY